MWIFGLGETLKRASLTSHASTSGLSGELCRVLADMTRPQPSSRASLMHLLDVSNIKPQLPVMLVFYLKKAEFLLSFDTSIVNDVFSFK